MKAMKEQIIKYVCYAGILFIIYKMISKSFAKPDLLAPKDKKVNAFNPALYKDIVEKNKLNKKLDLIGNNTMRVLANSLYGTKGTFSDDDGALINLLENNISNQADLSYFAEYFGKQKGTSLAKYLEFADKNTLSYLDRWAAKLPRFAKYNTKTGKTEV